MPCPRPGRGTGGIGFRELHFEHLTRTNISDRGEAEIVEAWPIPLLGIETPCFSMTVTVAFTASSPALHVPHTGLRQDAEPLGDFR